MRTDQPTSIDVVPATGSTEGHSQDELAQIVETCLNDLEAGRSIDVERLAAEHASLAVPLRDFFEGLKLVERVADSVFSSTADGAEVARARQIGDYRIGREIGRGGMGVVYEALQVSLNRRVALKILPLAAILDPRQIQRFQNEAQVAAQLHHTNIVPVHAVGCERGVYYYAMQYIEGQNLEAVIRDLREFAAAGGKGVAGSAVTPRLLEVVSPGGSTTSREFFRMVARLGMQTAEALEHAHDQGVVHRDIKPSNLLLDARGNIWITDFGLAKIQNGATLTLSGNLVGTLRYMSPEQALGKRRLLDHRTDIYSLAATLYEILTLEPAFSGSDREELLAKIAFEEPRPPRQRNRALPMDLETIVLRAMEKNPDSRYSTARELAEDLRRFLEGKPIQAQRPTPWKKAAKWLHRHRAMAAAGVIMLVLAVAGLSASTFLIWQAQRRTNDALQQAKTQYEAAERARATAAQEQLHAVEFLARSQIERGQAMLADGNSLGLLDLLDAASGAEKLPGLRKLSSWLWSAWHQEHSARLLNAFGNQGTGRLRAAKFSRDGRFLATGWEKPDTAQLWHVESGLPQQPLAHEAPVTSLLFSPDGGLLVTAALDGTLRLWDVMRPELKCPTMRHGQGTVLGLAFRPDGKLLASASRAEGTVKLWDAQTGAPYGQTMEWASVAGVEFSPDGSLLATGSASGGGRLWYTSSQEPYGARFPGGGPGKGHRVNFSPDGRLVAVSEPGSAQLYDVSSLEPRGQPMKHRGTFWFASFSPDGALFLTSAADREGSVCLWETATGKLLREIRQESIVDQAAFSPDGKLLATASWNGKAQVWNINLGIPRGPPFVHQGRVRQVHFSPDGKLLATFSEDGAGRLWALEAPVPGRLLRVRKESKFAFHPDGSLLAAVSADGMVSLWKTNSEEVSAPVLDLHGSLSALAFGADGELLAVERSEGKTQLWKKGGGPPQAWPLDVPRDATAIMAFSSRGKFLALGGSEGSLQLWLTATGQPRGPPVELGEKIQALSFSPDEKLLAVAPASGPQLWDTETWQRSSLTFGPETPCASIAWSPDGKILATGLNPGGLQLWDVATGAKRGGPLQHQNSVWKAAFNLDGELVGTLSGVHSLRLWRLMPSAGVPCQSVTWRCPAPPVDLSFSPDGKQVAIRLTNDTIWVRDLPVAPSSLRQMELRTWLALGVRRGTQGDAEMVPWNDWRRMQEDLRALGN